MKKWRIEVGRRCLMENMVGKVDASTTGKYK